MRMTEHYHSLTREFVEPPSLEILKSCLDMVLGSWLQVTLLEPGRLDQMTCRGPFRPQPFCDSVVLQGLSKDCNYRGVLLCPGIRMG